MTRFIIGKAGVDVSARLRAKLMEDIVNGKKVTLIVPDQYEYETEKLMYHTCADAGKITSFTNISVRSFSKLAEDIIARYAGGKKPASDITKNILMYRAVSEIRDQLTAFGKAAGKSGFAPKMTSTIAMLKTGGISVSDFSKTVSGISEDFRDSSPALFAKLEDISMIYTAYSALLSEAYSDRLDCTRIAAQLAAEHGYFRGCELYCDGFSDFSESQMELLYSAIDLSENVTFAFTSDVTAQERDIFTTINHSVSLLAQHSRDADIPTSGDDTTSDGSERFSCPALNELSECIFTERTSSCAHDGIRLISADDVHDEAAFIAAEIRRLITKENLRCSDIAVLCTDPESYKSPLESAFDKYELPIFCDIPESILHLPLTNLLLSLLNVLKSFTVENVLSYVKTDFLQNRDKEAFSMSDINCFENYIYEWGLKPENLTEAFPDIDGHTPRAEAIRQDVIPPLVKLRESLKNADGAEITEAVCNFLFDEVGIQRAITARCKKPGSEVLTDSDKETAAYYQTLWNTLTEILEALYKGLHGYKISLSDYCELVRDICRHTTLANPPQFIDSVLVGDIRRTRVDGIKAVFICGADYDRFPAEEAASGVFTEYETELLGESVIKLSKNRKERYCYNRYLAYKAMAIPQERLYISCPALDISCKTVSRSEIFSMISAIFSGIQVERTGSMGDTFFCSSLRAAQQRYASVCTQDTEQRATLRSALETCDSSDYVDRLDELIDRRAASYCHKLDPETAEALFRSRTFSATKLERLNKCRFEYFCSNGLRITERNRRDITGLEIGNAVHYALQKTLEKYCGSMDDFVKLTRADLSKEAQYYLNEYKDIKLGGNYAKTLRFNYLYRNLTTNVTDILVLLQNEFAARDYRPKFFELSIGGEDATASSVSTGNGALSFDKIPVPTLNDNEQTVYDQLTATPSANKAGSQSTTINTPPLSVNVRSDLTVNITGIVDRADTFTDEHGNEYIRVVDYKTGKQDFSMVNVYYGINTQMLLYLIALCDANPDLHPGGVSYLPSQMTDSSDKRKSAAALLAGEHIQKGMYISTPQTDAEMQKYAQTMYERSGVKPDKHLTSSENKVTTEQFEQLKQELLTQTTDVVCKLYNGDVDAIPTVFRNGSSEDKACSYCRYAHICGGREDMQVQVIPRTPDDSASPDNGGNAPKSDENNGKETKA